MVGYNESRTRVLYDIKEGVSKEVWGIHKSEKSEDTKLKFNLADKKQILSKESRENKHNCQVDVINKVCTSRCMAKKLFTLCFFRTKNVCL